MHSRIWLVGPILLLTLLAGTGPGTAHAQPARVSSVEFVTGRAGFVDEVWDQFTMLGGGLKVRLTPRFALGPEIVYLDGARRSHALMLTASGTVDLVSPRPDRRVVPFLVFGAGLLRQTSVVGGGPGSSGVRSFTSGEGTVSGGVGVRVAVNRHWTVAPDARIGYEPESRFGVAVAWRP